MDAPRRRLWMQPGVRPLLLWLYGIPLIGNFNVISSIVWVLNTAPPGTAIRPMGLAMWIGIVAFITALCGLGLGIITIVMWRKIPLLVINGLVSSVLSLTPFGVGALFFRWYAAYRGLILSD